MTTVSSVSPTTAPTSLADPFLALPTELVGWIFDIVDDAIPVTSNALGLVSRTFLPFVRHKTFERVNLWSPRRLLAFDFTSRVSIDDVGILLDKANSSRPPELSVVTLNTLRLGDNRDSLLTSCCIDESDGELSICSEGSRADGFGLSMRDAGAWTDEYTMTGVRKVMELGEEVGIGLRGNDVETVKEVREIFKEDPSYWTTRAKA